MKMVARNIAGRVAGTEHDPVFVDAYGRDKVELQIGVSERGKSRFALLSASDARLVAYALLAAAEKAESSN